VWNKGVNRARTGFFTVFFGQDTILFTVSIDPFVHLNLGLLSWNFIL